MNEIITGLQVIKMYTWEKSFAKIVEGIRRKEIEQIRISATIKAVMMSLNWVLNRVAIGICILTFFLTGNTLTATYAYTVFAFYGVMKTAVTMHFPKAISQTSETKISIERIQKFLLYDERSKIVEIHSKVFLNRISEKETSYEKVGIHLKNLSVKWLESLPENNLENITLKVNPNQFVAIVGQVGSGKTTLLHAILKELYPTDGSMEVHGKISYASQEPWVFGGSVRQNILFGLDYEPKKYEEVVRVCALQRDLTILPHGDQTIVGERGVTLSGGQKARINLARAVYKEADIYLLDDPLSAVDTHVGKQLLDNCICGYLKNRCVILVTHQLQYLRNAECIYLLEHGKVRAAGTYQELHNVDSDFTNTLTEPEDEERIDGDPNSTKLNQADDTEIMESTPLISEKEQRNTGTVTWHIYKTYYRAGGSWCKTVAVFLGFLLTQIFLSSSDYFLSRWVNLGELKENMENSVTKAMNYSSFNGTFQATIKPLDMDAGDSWRFNLTEELSMGFYGSFIVLSFFTAILRSITYYNHCLTASKRLHDSMFAKIIHSPLEFFNKNPSGRILNRFSKDIGAVDEILPATSYETIEIGLAGIAISLVIATVNPWILLPTVIIIVIFYLIQQAHLTSSRTVKRVEATTRSPVYTHLAASMQGLTTIRAFGAEEILTKEFDRHQDTHTSAFYLYMSAGRGFGFWLDFHCVIYIGFVIMSILFLEDESLGGNIGLSLTQSMLMTGMFQWGMRQWAEFETQMTSVERIQDYADIVPERDTYSKDPPKSWPENGKIVFVNLNLKYSENDPYVLENVNFEVNPREKVGIVGRTGAGKTSLIQALFRLTHIDGSILIDGVDTRTIPLKALRSKISIIPQDPVLFTGTLRENLDPFDEYKDEELWNALEDVELKNVVEELSTGLDGKMAESGSNFSVGQRQLFCLARAILRNNKILVLDEATANVDPQTDALIQNTIRKKFMNCTVLTIAHRLHTIMDSDKVLVMDAGRVVEFDHPFNLLQNKNGVFHRLVEQTGISAAQNLSGIAAKNISETST
ncbi:hypothetical protein JTB14_021536 [Gonioctena quinquepunctata]|nr:hypothetical protein JTB14_021536 [Gonioctena quinquepunctata]